MLETCRDWLARSCGRPTLKRPQCIGILQAVPDARLQAGVFEKLGNAFVTARWPRLALACWTLVAAIAAVAGSPPIAAQETTNLEIVVQQRGGRPVAGLSLNVMKLREGLPEFQMVTRTDERGRVLYSTDQGGGVFQFGLGDVSRRGLVAPENDPYSTPPKISIERGESRQLVIELIRGVRVTTQVIVDSPMTKGFSLGLVFTHRATGVEVKSSWSPARPPPEVLLTPGAWQVRSSAPSGFLLTEVWRDGIDVLGSETLLDLLDERADVDLAFTFVAEASVLGQIDVVGETPPGLRLRAELIEAGEWGGDASARGGSRVDIVERSRDRVTGLFELPLPSGRWLLRPIANVEVTSEPESREVTVAVGAEEQVSFQVEAAGDLDHLVPLTVKVSRYRGGTYKEAEVELYDASGFVADGVTDEGGSVEFFGLEQGTLYTVIADHLETLAGASEITFHPTRSRRANPESGEPQLGSRLFIPLERGAGFIVEGIGAKGLAQPGIEVLVERFLDEGEEPDAEIGSIDEVLREPRGGGSAAEIQRVLMARDRAASNRRTVMTARGGVGELSGLVKGLYALNGRLTGADASLGAVELRLDGEAGWAPADEELTVNLKADEVRQVYARVVPRASFAARMVCDDGGALPNTADVEIYRAIETRGGVSVGVRDEDPALQLDVRPIGSSGLLQVGPLDRGAFEMAVRPSGFDRWTWAFEASSRDGALVLGVESADVRQGRTLSLGDFVVECAAAMDVVLEPADSAILRDGQLKVAVKMFDLTYARGGRPAEGDTPEDEAFRELPAPKSRWSGNVLELRGLPPIKLRLRVELSHPDISASGVLLREFVLEPERGSYLLEIVDL